MTRNRTSGFGHRAAGTVALTVMLCLALISASPGQTNKGYKVVSYTATVRLDRMQDSLFGEVTMIGRADTALSGILQHVKYILVDSVDVNSARASTQTTDTVSGAYLIAPPKGISPGEIFTVHTFFHGRGRPEQAGSMTWGGVTDQDTMMFAMGVGFQAPYVGCTRHWLPCYDLPDDKPDSVDLTFLCRDGEVTASNGLLVGNSLQDGWRKMHWHVGHPIATYLLTFATGPYTEQNITNSLGIPFEVYALKRDSALAGIHMNVRVRQVLAFYDSLFAPYPFEKVGYVVTPFGSMEHQTMISLDKRVLVGDSASMVADSGGSGTTAIHELAHMWWGDRVTCQTFDDAWLNEGFATFCESLVLEHLFHRSTYLTRQHGNIANAKTSTLPLFGASTVDKHTDNYPYTTIYQKGAAVLGMLRQYLGDSVFFECVRHFGNVHAYSTATSWDLERAFEDVSGQDLGWFFKPWVFGTGYPKDTIVWSRSATGAKITFHQATNSASTPHFRMCIPVRGTTNSGLSKTVNVWMDSTYLSSDFANFGFSPDTLVFDPDGLLVMKIAHATLSVASPDGGESAYPFRVYPNPNRNRQLEFTAGLPSGSGRCELLIYDMQGRITRHISYDSVGRTLHGSVSMSGLSSGSYRLCLTSENGYFVNCPFTVED